MEQETFHFRNKNTYIYKNGTEIGTDHSVPNCDVKGINC